MRYYGGKSKLLEFIHQGAVQAGMRPEDTFFDGFSGTASVGIHFKKNGHQIYSNDLLHFSYCLASTHIALNKKPAFHQLENDPIEILNNLKPKVGFFSKNYSPVGAEGRQYFSSENAKKIDSIREQIFKWKTDGLISQSEELYLITSLLEAANLTSNVTGTYAAYLKTWDSRSLNPIKLAHPKIVSNGLKNYSFNSDLVEIVGSTKVDVLYLDPPYNSRQYASNYFLLDVISHGWFEVKPEVNGVTGMRDNSAYKSKFSSKKFAADALDEVVRAADAKLILLSYNNEGIIASSEIMEILSQRGAVTENQFIHKRYRAINQDGSNTATVESLFIVEVKK